jgi:hypothetical protein
MTTFSPAPTPTPTPSMAPPNGQPPAASGYLPDAYAPPQPHAAPPVPSPVGDRLPRMRRPRRPALAVVGVMLVLLCGVASAALATAGNHRVRVVTLVHDVHAGQVLSADDLTVASISGSGVQALSAAGLNNVVGQTIIATLPAGTLLNTSMLTTVSLPSTGLQLVAVAVKAGGVPQQAVPGRDVNLIRVPSPAAGDAKGTVATVLVAKARLVSTSKDDATGLQVLSVEVPQAAALAVAQASAAGAIAVTLLPVSP